MNLRDWLINRDIKQEDFAKKVNVCRAHLSSIVSGYRKAGKKLAQSIELETDGAITAKNILSKKATGYKGKPKRAKKKPEKPLPNNSLSLL